MEPKKNTHIAKTILSKKNKAGDITLLISNYITRLQKPKNHGTGTKTDIYTNETEQRPQQ